LQPEADPPVDRTNRMDGEPFPANDPIPAPDHAETQIRILTVGTREALVEAAHLG
jgi:hypothetical protein